MLACTCSGDIATSGGLDFIIHVYVTLKAMYVPECCATLWRCLMRYFSTARLTEGS